MQHGVTPDDLDSVMHNAPRYFANLPGRSAPFVMIGPDHNGDFFQAAILPTVDPAAWYPVTGWRMNARRARRLYESR
jgi:hypothetical protein